MKGMEFKMSTQKTTIKTEENIDEIFEQSSIWDADMNVQLFRNYCVSELSKRGHFDNLYENGKISQTAIERVYIAFRKYFDDIYEEDHFKTVVDACQAAQIVMNEWSGIPDPVMIDRINVHLTFPFGRQTMTLEASGAMTDSDMPAAYSFLIGKIAKAYEEIAKSQGINIKDSQGSQPPQSTLPEVRGGMPGNNPAIGTGQGGQWEDISVQMKCIQVEWKNNKRYLSMETAYNPRIKYPVAIYPERIKSNVQIDFGNLPMGTNPITGTCIVTFKDGKPKFIKEIIAQ